MAVTIETLTQSIADNDFSACASVISLLDDADFTNAQKAAKLIADACRHFAYYGQHTYLSQSRTC